MKTAELRRLFLDYFEARGHLIVPSSSLVPQNDPTVLLTTAGMQQFKPYFMGLEEPPAKRLASLQKCFRTSDIDQVGLTARHCTFFEMLGNFSVGDYFKREAIEFAWEYSLECLGFDADRIWISYFEGDDEIETDHETTALWEAIGVPRERMVGLPRSDNFWGPVGPTGPCGPCSELYYDRGPEHGCGDPSCRPGCECDRFVEYWNLVFTGYHMDEERRLTPLPAQHIDTGMGLERVVALKQDVDSVFLTDIFRPLIYLAEEYAGKTYGEDPEADVSLRILADHSRAMCFLIADGVLPGNEGRGYVLRRIIRRAARVCRSLGMEAPVLGRFAERTIEVMGDPYRELVERRPDILRVIGSEEERFNRTLGQGLVLVEEQISKAEAEGITVLPGSVAFTLHDTYGFPVEVTQEIVAERGMTLDMDGFKAAMEEQRNRARQAKRGGDEEQEAVARFIRDTPRGTDFKGYEREDLFTVIENVHALGEDKILLALRESPFYAEGGGQTADGGIVESDTGKAQVVDVQQHGELQVITARLLDGRLVAGTRAKASLAIGHRHDVAVNHTATHLLHYALRARLGKDVTQAGSSVRADRLRFDFSYHEPLGPERLAQVEELVNRRIGENHPVRMFTTSLEHARDLGVIGLFEDKYGEFVRVVEIDDFSRELCGGTHVGSTSELQIFKILSESSVGANVRRIEAVCGPAAVTYYRERERILNEAAGRLGTPGTDIGTAVEKLQARLAKVESDCKALASEAGKDTAGGLVAEAEAHDGVNVVAAVVEARDMEHLLSLLDQVRDRVAPALVALGADIDDKGALVVGVSKGVKNVHAGDIVKEAARAYGGGGGGAPHLGRSGGGDPSRLPDAVEAAKRGLLEALKR